MKYGIFSKSFKSGIRTYFFDVKKTKNNEYYLIINESKKMFRSDGTYYYKKYKLNLHSKNFEKFVENLNEIINFINTNKETIEEENKNKN